MGKTTQPKVIIEPGKDWVKVTSIDAYIQNIDDEPIVFAFGDTKPTIGKEDGHVFKQEQNDYYVNEAGDTLWMHQDTHRQVMLSISTWS